MEIYALYTYEIKPSIQMNATKTLFPGFFNIFGKSLPTAKKKTRNNVEEPLGNLIYKHDEIIAMCLENTKNVGIWKKMNKTQVESNPFCNIIIDTREGHNNIAIQRNTAFRNTDQVGKLLETALHEILFDYEMDITIESQTHGGSFWSIVNEQTHNHQDYVTKAVFHFNEMSQEKVEKLGHVSDNVLCLMKMAAKKGVKKSKYEMESDNKNEGRIEFDETDEDIAQMEKLCRDNRDYSLSVYFRYYGIYKYGQEVRLQIPMRMNEFEEFRDGIMRSHGSESTYELIIWLDRINDVIKRNKPRRNEMATKFAGKKNC